MRLAMARPARLHDSIDRRLKDRPEMTAETILTNARIVLPDEIVEGSLLLRDGLIAAIETGAARAGEDMGGDYIIPGLVELHTDHLEGHYAPRPKVRWNPIAADSASTALGNSANAPSPINFTSRPP